jgi:N-acetylglucosaminyldiphosphoundecaprenol N-acetyl-beta-D-mannosaminyltransferase
MASPDWQRILGVRFFNGAAPDAVDYITRVGGYTVVPAAPALVKIEDDPAYRRALVEADLAIADSGFMVLLWRLLQRRTVARISGLKYLRILLANPRLRERGITFLVLPHESSREKALVWLRKEGFEITADDCYIAPMYQSCSHGSVSREERERDSSSTSSGQAFSPSGRPLLAGSLPAGAEERLPGMVALQTAKSPVVEDRDLVNILEHRKPKHIIVGIGGGSQEKLGLYLREHLSYRPAIHCIGAALAFLTGDQKPIPMWADRLYLGWFLRLARAPRHYARRFSPAFRLPGMIWRYGSELPVRSREPGGGEQGVTTRLRDNRTTRP